MLNDHSRGYLQSCCYSKQLSMALLHVSYPPAQICGGEDILHISFFLYFLDTLSSEPNYKSPFEAPPLGCTLVQYYFYLQLLFYVTCPVPTNVKEECISSFYFLSSLRDLLTLLSHFSLIYHQWISCSLPCVFSFDSKCIKQTAKLPFCGAFSQSF